MEQAYLVEEQELKERVFTEAIKAAKTNPDWDVEFWQGMHNLKNAVMNYEIIRDRNDNIRKQEYREKRNMTKS